MDENEPLVSVIIPTKNSETTIEVCLKSIKAQTYPNIELIVVDSSTRDHTRKIAKEYGAEALSGAFNKPTARNRGSSYAKGEYLAHLDSDMELTARVIESCVVKAEEGFDAVVIPEVSIGRGFFSKCRTWEKLSYFDSGSIEAARFVKKAVYESVGGFDERIDGPDEWDFHATLEERGFRIGRVGEVIKVHENISLSNLIRKKFKHGNTFSIYKEKHPQKAFEQTSPTRISGYYRVFKKSPIQGCGILVLKIVEASSFLLGCLVRTMPKLKSSQNRGSLKKRHVQAKFDTLADSYEKEMYRDSLGDQYVDQVEKEAVLQQIDKFSKKPGLSLDLGAGGGRWSHQLLNLGLEVIAIDISREMCKGLQHREKQSKFSVIQASMDLLPIKDDCIQLVNCFRTLKYLPDHKEVLQEVHRVLRTQGTFIVEIPNLLSPFYSATHSVAPLLRRVVDRPTIGYLADVKLFYRRIFETDAKRVGFQVVHFVPLFVFPHMTYSRVRQPIVLKFLRKAEHSLKKILPTSISPRSLIVVLSKRGDIT